MSAFELTRAAAERHDQATGADGGPDAIVQAGELVIRESREAWIASEDWLEVDQ